MRPLLASAFLMCGTSVLAAPPNEPQPISERGIVLAPQDVRLDSSFISWVFDMGSQSNSGVFAFMYSHVFWANSMAWSPVKNLEVGSRFLTVGSRRTTFLNSLWARYRFLDRPAEQAGLELGAHLSLNGSFLEIGLPARYHLTDRLSLSFTPMAHLALRDDYLHSLSLDLQLAWNLTRGLYLALQFNPQLSLEDSFHLIGGGARLGYAFSKRGEAFFDLELAYQRHLGVWDGFEEGDYLTQHRVELNFRRHF